MQIDTTEAKRPPSPDGLPVLGQLGGVSRGPLEYCREHASMDDVVALELLHKRLYLVTDPPLIEQVIRSDRDAFATPTFLRRALGPVFGESLLLTDGEQWRRQRETLQPAFYRDRVRSCIPTVVERTTERLAAWDDGQRIDVTEEMQRITMDALLDTLFGADGSLDRDAIRRAVDDLISRFDAPLSPLLPPWVPTPANRRFSAAIETLQAEIDGLIERTRSGATDADGIVALLLAARDDGRLSPETVRDELALFLLEGYATTAVALTHAWYELGRNRTVRTELADEVDRVVDGDAPTIRDITALEIADRIVRETLRKHPPVYAIFREPATDVQIGEFRLREGSLVCLPQFVLHRDDRYYDEPDAFRPERWNGSLEDELPEYAYFPFGGGPRHCIGSRFATLEMRAMLATIAREFHIDPESTAPLSVSPGLVARPENPVTATLNER